MFGISVRQAAMICGGKLTSKEGLDREIRSCVIDSRKIREGDLFVAYKGEKVDGHRYISSSLDQGAACCLAEYVPEGETRPVIVVENVQTAFERLVAAFRAQLQIPVIGITGSVGKTTTKEMISAVVGEAMQILKTEGNMNNQIGVPVTVSRIMPEDRAAIVEMGINHFGEMTDLGKSARPDIAVYTVIGHAHLEFLNDLDGVLKAKTEMLDYMNPNGVIIVNGDDEKLAGLTSDKKILHYGMGENCELKATDIRTLNAFETLFTANYNGTSFPVTINAYGKQMIYAALAGIAVGLTMGIDPDTICRGIGKYVPVGRRSNVVRKETFTLIDDCYNANPDSVKCALDSLMEMNGPHLAVLGDMLELGEEAEQMHREVGCYAKEKGIERLLCCGPHSKMTAEAFGENAEWFSTMEELNEAIGTRIREGEYVLLKASLGMKFATISDTVKAL